MSHVIFDHGLPFGSGPMKNVFHCIGLKCAFLLECVQRNGGTQIIQEKRLMERWPSGWWGQETEREGGRRGKRRQLNIQHRRKQTVEKKLKILIDI